MSQIQTMDPAKLQLLLNFLHHTKSTAVFEILQPSYQHVVDLSYLGSNPALKFITWTCAFKDESKGLESFCSIRPDKALDFAQSLGLETVKYEVIEASKADERMHLVRKGIVVFIRTKSPNFIPYSLG